MPTTFPADDIQSSLIYEFLQTTDVVAIAEDRVYANVIPHTVQHKYAVVVSLVNVDRFVLLAGYNGRARSTIQIDSYGDEKIRVNALSKACKLRVNAGGTFGDLVLLGYRFLGEFDLPAGAADQPADGSDRWRYRRALRYDLEYCEDI